MEGGSMNGNSKRLRELAGVPAGWVLVPANETTAFAGRLIHTIELPDGFALSGEALVDGIVRLVARDGQPAGKVALRAAPQPPAEEQAQGGGEAVYQLAGEFGEEWLDCSEAVFEWWQGRGRKSRKLYTAPPSAPDGWNAQGYAAMRDDLEAWKQRALAAEAGIQRMTDDLNAENGPTHMGEVVLPPSAPVGDVGEIMHKALCRIALGQEPAQTIADDAIAEARKAALAQQPAPSAPVGVEDTRAAFERWVQKRHGADLTRWADSGKYRYDNTTTWWECWQAALAQQPAAVTQPADAGVSNGSGQPAAVDGAMIALRDLHERVLPAAIRYHNTAPGYVEEAQEIVARALAAQPGGSDNE